MLMIILRFHVSTSFAGRSGFLKLPSTNSGPLLVYLSGDPTMLTSTKLDEINKTEEADGSFKYEFQLRRWVSPKDGKKALHLISYVMLMFKRDAYSKIYCQK